MQGIYKIENKVNGKVYIGQSTDIEARWQHHIIYLTEHIHGNPHLQNAWNKYGSDKFNFSVIEECEYDMLTEREQYWIDYYGGIESSKTYNLRDANIGGHLSEQTREKLRQVGLGKEPWNKGLTVDTDDRVKRYVENNNHILSVESKQKISETVKQRHKEGIYDYNDIAKKRLATIERNGTVRKDKGTKKGSYSEYHCKRISEGKIKANEEKRKLGLPIRVKKKSTPMKTTICKFCGKEFQQRQCHYKVFCSRQCYIQSKRSDKK